MWAGSGASNLANASAYETTLVLAANTTVTAIFEKIDYTLAIDVASGNGSVSPASGTSYNYDTGLGISATADAGWEFTGWTGDTGNLANPGAATTTINSDTFGNTTVHANFVKIDYTLTIDVATGNGSVSPASGTNYNYDTALGISATADAGWVFTGWTGDTGNLANPGAATTTINSDTFGNTTVHANFVKIDYTLTIDVATGNGSVSPASGTNYNYDTALGISATADAGWVFTGWTGDTGNLANPGAATTTINSDTFGNTTVHANFEKIDYTLTIDVASGNGSVSPVSGTTYNYDTALGISATADPGWEFAGWTGDTGNLTDPNAAATTIKANTFGNTTVHANFEKIDYTLTIDVASGNGSVSPASGTTYNYDTALGISATADPGWEFTGWTGDTGNLTNPAAATTTIKANTFSNTTVLRILRRSITP